jgi:hypothetical protein
MRQPVPRVPVKIYRDKSEFDGSCYFELLPGPFCGKWWNSGSIFISEHTWSSYVASLIVGRVYDYDQYSEVEVPRELWTPVLHDLERLRTIVLDVESVWELNVEAHLTDSYDPFQYDRDFAQAKAELLLFIEELHGWLTTTLTTHSSISILGL